MKIEDNSTQKMQTSQNNNIENIEGSLFFSLNKKYITKKNRIQQTLNLR